jgi:outer membrane protein assembly factor BamB
VRTPISCRFFAQLLTYGLVAAVAAPALAQQRQLLPILPETIRWSVAVSTAATSPPVMSKQHVFAVLPPGVVAAFRLEDGKETWRVDLSADQPLVVSDDRVFVAAGEAIHALAAATGAVAWRQPSGTLTAPLLVQDGWVIASTADAVTARRASDGTVVWTAAVGPQRERASIEGDTLYLPLTDKRIVAINLTTGKQRWQRKLIGVPSEILPIAKHVYFGADDKFFYCLDAGSGHQEWRLRVGAATIGKPAIDAERVYFGAMDNMLHAVSPRGTIRWQATLPFRPTAGPQLVDAVVLVPGAAADLQTFDVRTGKPISPIGFGGRLATPPSFQQTEKGPLAVAVIGGLTAEWKIAVLEPSMAIPVAPLTVLPGVPLKSLGPAAAGVGALLVRPPRPPRDAAHLP